MKHKKNNSLTVSLAKLRYVAPILLAVSLGWLSAQAFAGDTDEGNENNSLFVTKLNENLALRGHYLGAEKATREIFDLNVVEALESDVLVQGDYLTWEVGFDNQINDTASQAAILKTTAKSLLVGYNFKKLSWNGRDKLVFGVFGGYGLITQFVSLATEESVVEEQAAKATNYFQIGETEAEEPTEPAEPTTTEDPGDTPAEPPTEVKNYFDVESDGFLGGAYLAYQSHADEPTGLRLGAVVQYSRFTHQFAAGSDLPKEGEKKPATLIYKVDRIGAKAQMAYTLKLGAIGSYPFLVTQSNQITVNKDLSNSKKTEASTEALVSFTNDLQLALSIEDKGLLPFISGGFVQNGASKDSAGQEISERVDLELGGGLSWKVEENLTLQFKLLQSRKWKATASSDKETKINGYKSCFGLTYLF